ncbi:ABC transporter ATP-binding protein [Paenibacillus sp. N1-5-1-14]|uniref:ATP-binding cassette domain-containing protein n=1 Tax=Paenibacillus radicibacter TaxID=2972488 RepID=UPI002158CA19|nr:ABC transporter ATP-binding protein [Paenibacillus radicibacter]MCR8643185.1 ABC transporter ATP-binding protein [Paenibacillus radicibacter]
MEANIAVAMKGVRKRLDTFEIGTIDLQLEEGFVYAVVGPNGAGKSTLFSMLMNGLKPDQGQVQMFGMDYEQDDVMIKRRIAYASNRQMWEEAELSTVKDLVDFESLWYPNWDSNQFTNLVKKFGIDRNAKLLKMSTGERQRLSIAVALAKNTDLLIMDEATNGLDFMTSKIIVDQIGKFMDNDGRTVVFATHILDEIKRLADYIILQENGVIKGIFEKDELLSTTKAYWIERLPEQGEQTPGVIRVDLTGRVTGPVRIITSQVQATESELIRQQIPIISVESLELDEILSFYMENN